MKLLIKKRSDRFKFVKSDQSVVSDSGSLENSLRF
jgi:hypothetical protein